MDAEQTDALHGAAAINAGELANLNAGVVAQQNAVAARTSVQQQLAQAQAAALGKANGQRAANWNAAAGQLFESVGRAIELEVVQAANKVLGGINTTLNIAMVGEIFGGEGLEPITGALRLGTDGLAAGAEALEASETAALDAAGGSLSAGAPAMTDSFVPAAAASGAETGLASVADNVAADASAAADNAIANGIIQAGEQAGPEAVVDAGELAGSVWDLPPVARGRLIEELLGQNLPDSFPTIDRFGNGVATSIKSIDLTAASYQHAGILTARIAGYLEKLRDFQGKDFGGAFVSNDMIRSKVLMLAIEPGVATAEQQTALDALQSQFGNMLKVVEIP
ncbi:MAG: hypothetical protein HKL95_08180 [Phycisphaerae bacterium]|nr:hypothetical protein [Phycisphaerae bacterium]